MAKFYVADFPMGSLSAKTVEDFKTLTSIDPNPARFNNSTAEVKSTGYTEVPQEAAQNSIEDVKILYAR